MTTQIRLRAQGAPHEPAEHLPLPRREHVAGRGALQGDQQRIVRRIVAEVGDAREQVKELRRMLVFVHDRQQLVDALPAFAVFLRELEQLLLEMTFPACAHVFSSNLGTSPTRTRQPWARDAATSSSRARYTPTSGCSAANGVSVARTSSSWSM